MSMEGIGKTAGKAALELGEQALKRLETAGGELARDAAARAEQLLAGGARTADRSAVGGARKGVPASLPAHDALRPRAQAALTGLELLQHTHGRARLTDELKQLLVAGVGTPLGIGTWGHAGAIGKDDALKAAGALLEMTAGEFRRAMALLRAADKPPVAAPALEQALILKAIGAGYKADRSPLVALDLKRNDVFFDRLAEFARDLHGKPPAELIRDTSLIGSVKLADGLKQPHVNGCGPTDIELLKGEEDPMYAWTRRRNPGIVVRETEHWLERDGGGIAIPRAARRSYRAFREAIAARREALRQAEPAGHELFLAHGTLKRYLTQPGFAPDAAESRQILRALADLRAQGGDFYKAAADHVREQVREHGLKAFESGGQGMAISEALNRRTGRVYATEAVGDGRGLVKPLYLDLAAEILAAGQPVPLRIGYKPDLVGGHFMLLSDVRGDAAAREFLVSDPWTGATAWVKQADLRSGAFAAAPRYGFQLGDARTTHMYFPLG